jgi:acylphosphatase
MTQPTGGTQPQRLEAVVHGRVHGVGFRAFTLRAAREHALEGWVANEAGGRVRVVAEGEPGALHALIQALRVGPAAALVDRVDETWSPASGEFRSFEIRSGWHGGD